MPLSHGGCPSPRRKNSFAAAAVPFFGCETRQQNVKSPGAFAFVRLRRYIFVRLREARNETDSWIDWAGADGQADGAQFAASGIPPGGVESDGGACAGAGKGRRESGGESGGDVCRRGCADHDRERSAGAGRSFDLGGRRII